MSNTLMDDEAIPGAVHPSSSFISTKPLKSSVTRPPPSTSTGQFWFACAVFLSLGMTNFFGYSAMLNSGHAIQKFVFVDSKSLADTIPAMFMTSDFLFTGLLSFYGSLNRYLIYVGLGMMSLGTLAICFVCEFLEGYTGAVLLHILCAIVGTGSSISCSASFTLANQLRNPTFAATVSTGGGATGVFSFALWMLLTQLLFPYDSVGVRNSLWVLFGVGTLLPVVAFVLYSIFIRLEWVKKYLAGEVLLATIAHAEHENVHAEHANIETIVKVDDQIESREVSSCSVLELSSGTTTPSKDEPKQETGNKESTSFISLRKDRSATFRMRCADWLRIVCICYPALLLAFFSMFLTYIICPVVGPLHWTITPTQVDIVLGLFQVGDMIGRYTPILGGYLPFFRPSIKNAFIFVIACRIILIPTFILSQRLPNAVVFGDYWFQLLEVLILALSMGWASTIVMIYVPTYLDLDDKLGRSKANSLGVFGILAGISVGQWTSNLLKL